MKIDSNSWIRQEGENRWYWEFIAWPKDRPGATPVFHAYGTEQNEVKAGRCVDQAKAEWRKNRRTLIRRYEGKLRK